MIMEKSFRLGRIAGIDVRVDWSWALIFLLVTFNLTTLFKTWHQDWTVGAAGMVATLGSLLFFGSVLLHELAHCFVARLNQVPVRRITLHMLGGAAEIDREPPSPGAEAAIAIVGPVVSLVIGVGSLLLARALKAVEPAVFDFTAFGGRTLVVEMMTLGPAVTVLGWLGSVNVMLALFNLIPGFPLDGGRVLRACLWRATGDLRTATRWAARAGEFAGWTFVLLGLSMMFGARVPIFGTGLVAGVWLTLIGWFLRNAAVLSLGRTVIEDALDGMTVRHVMRTYLPWVPPTLSVRQLVSDWFMAHDERAIAVIADGRLIGLVSVSDVRKVPASDWDSCRVGDIMTKGHELVSVSPSDDLTDAWVKLRRSSVSQAPVFDGERWIGMLYDRDVTRVIELHVPSSPLTDSPRMVSR
jgi:Zn-dependent protease